MFKRQPKPRTDPIADKVLESIKAQSADQNDANDAFAAGKAAEAADDLEGSINAYLACADAWQRHFQNTGIAVPPEPYMRLGVLLRKAKDMDGEISVLEAYMACAGRDPDMRLQDRLERAYELAEPDEEEPED